MGKEDTKGKVRQVPLFQRTHKASTQGCCNRVEPIRGHGPTLPISQTSWVAPHQCDYTRNAAGMQDPPAENSGKRGRKAKNEGDGFTPLNQRAETVTKLLNVATSPYAAVTKAVIFMALRHRAKSHCVNQKKNQNTTKPPNQKTLRGGGRWGFFKPSLISQLLQAKQQISIVTQKCHPKSLCASTFAKCTFKRERRRVSVTEKVWLNNKY